jgi:hypothetical protein
MKEAIRRSPLQWGIASANAACVLNSRIYSRLLALAIRHADLLM